MDNQENKLISEDELRDIQKKEYYMISYFGMKPISEHEISQCKFLKHYGIWTIVQKGKIHGIREFFYYKKGKYITTGHFSEKLLTNKLDKYGL